MDVSLTPELERFVKEQVEAGRYQDVSEVIREALRVQLERQDAILALNRKIERGLADADAGRLHSPDEAWAILDERRRARAGKSS